MAVRSRQGITQTPGMGQKLSAETMVFLQTVNQDKMFRGRKKSMKDQEPKEKKPWRQTPAMLGCAKCSIITTSCPGEGKEVKFYFSS